MSQTEDPRKCCAACGALPPQTNSPYTLISATHGWRLTREETPDGRMVGRFYCAACWNQRKKLSLERSA
jgi:hypothetical protein